MQVSTLLARAGSALALTGRQTALGCGALALAGLTLLGGHAVSRSGSDAPNAPSTGAGGNSSWNAGGGGDETVGTLPSWNGGPTLDVLRFGRITRPSLYVQGSADAVLSSAVVVRGDRRVLARVQPTGELRLIFVGAAQVGFDRHAFEGGIGGGLQVGVALPEGAAVLRTQASWNGQDLPWWTYVYELPIAQFTANGLLDQAPVQAGIATDHGARSVRAHADQDLVVLTQFR